MQSLAGLALLGALAGGMDGDAHLDAALQARLEESLVSAAGWIASHQDTDGAFRSSARGGVPPVPLTAMALWAMTEVGDAGSATACRAAARFLVSQQQPDGGIYDPARGLVNYTTAIARQGLERWLE